MYIYIFSINTLVLNTYYLPGTLLVAGKQMTKILRFFFFPVITYQML